MTLGAGRDHWIAVLEGAGLPIGRVQDMAEALADPQVVARNMVVDLRPDAKRRRFRISGNPIKMTGLPDPQDRPPAPLLDQDRQAVLDWLDAGG